jgi:uncharacterized membrane protein YebE (DUF533 family)
MIDYRKLLDVVVGALSRPEHRGQAGSSPASHAASETGQAANQLLEKAKDMASQHPALTQAALLGLAGLVFKGRRKGGIASNLVRLGGLALIGGLAYKAYQSRQAITGTARKTNEREALPVEAPPLGEATGTFDVPPASRFHPVSQTEDDALLFLRTMVAAAAADGHIDEAERSRIIKGLSEAGVDPQANRWLEDEMASPADVEELAASVNDLEKAAQVYAAARIAINPDSIQEREFLHQLAEALDLDRDLRAQIDETADALR